MADLSRIHDFDSKTGQAIVGQDIDDELDQLVARINDVDADSLAAALAQALGVSQAGAVRRGKSIVATEQSTSSTSYTMLTTPDRVQNVVLPTDGLIVVKFSALAKASASNGAAAIFVASSQLQVAQGAAAPANQEASPIGDAGTNYEWIYTTPNSAIAGHGGLARLPGGLGGASRGTPIAPGGSIEIEMPAGTYDVSVRFKVSSGSLTVKERKLWVCSQDF
jgi:hypothetical protein